MKYYSLLILCCLLPFLICDDLIILNNVVQKFESELKKVFEEIKIKDSGLFENVVFKVQDFNKNNIKFSQLDNGFIILKISGCKAYITGTKIVNLVLFRAKKTFTVELKNFELSLKFKIDTRKYTNEYYALYNWKDVSDPSLSYTLSLINNSTIKKDILEILNSCQRFIKETILPTIRSRGKEAYIEIIKQTNAIN